MTQRCGCGGKRKHATPYSWECGRLSKEQLATIARASLFRPRPPDRLKILIKIGDMLAKRVPDYPDGSNARIIRRWVEISEDVLRRNR